MDALEGRIVRFQPSIRVRGTLSDNVFFQAGDKEAGLIAEVVPRITGRVEGPRLRLQGTAALQGFAWPMNGIDPRFDPLLNATARYEAVEDFFFIDARANINPIFVNPLGPGAPNAIPTDNRAYAYTYGISPYIQSQSPGGYRYQLRYNAVRNEFDQEGFLTTAITTLSGQVSSPIRRRVGWSLQANSLQFRIPNQPAFQNDIVRAQLIYQPDAQLQLFGIGGYEASGYANRVETSVYGLGGQWNPTPRTSMEAKWEERFFGPSYLAAFQHRTRLTSWRLRYLQNIQFFPLQALGLGTGGDVLYQQLDALLANTIPDPVERAAAVQRALEQLGFPVQATNAGAFVTPNIQLVERLEASVGLLGARNSVFLTLFESSNQQVLPISGLPDPAFNRFNEFRQRGFNVTGSHKFDALSSVNATFVLSRGTGVGGLGVNSTAESRQRTLFVNYNRRVGPRTNGTVGFRFNRFDSEGAGFAAFQERALIVGIDHRFN